MGEGEFVQSVLSELDDLHQENLRVKSPSLAEKVCQAHRVTLQEMGAGSRRRDVVAARRELCQVAVSLFGGRSGPLSGG